MILLDPDLDPDPDASPQASTSKRASSTRPTPIDRNARVPSARTLRRFLREAQAAVRLRGQVSVLLTTDKNIRRLNRQFRGKDKATDVLSFPAAEAVAPEVAGDLAVSVPTALRQAREQGHALAVELKVLILHGLLHLAGFDHERDDGQMALRERRLRGRLGLPPGLIERAAPPGQVSVRGLPPSRQKKGAKMGHGASVQEHTFQGAGPSARRRRA
jgi:probable rRNA maturation factor